MNGMKAEEFNFEYMIVKAETCGYEDDFEVSRGNPNTAKDADKH